MSLISTIGDCVFRQIWNNLILEIENGFQIKLLIETKPIVCLPWDPIKKMVIDVQSDRNTGNVKPYTCDVK